MDPRPSEQEVRTAAAVLGASHPLTRAIARRRAVARQVLVAMTPLPGAVATTLVGVGVAPLVLAATVVVALAFGGLWLGTRQAVSFCAEELIARGESTLALPVVARERRRLSSHGERERLARSLEGALEDARNWHRIPPRSRPLHGVRALRDAEHEVGDVVSALRLPSARVQGVALVSRLLCDGQQSPLYAGDAGSLREELRRIRRVLEPRREAPPGEHARRAA